MLRGLINDMSSSLYIKAALIDRMDNTLIYLSAGSYNNVIKTAAKELNKKGRVNIYTEGFFRTAKNKYNISIKKNDAIDCSHLVALAKDKITYDTNGNESALCYFLIEEDKDLPDITFKKLSEFSSIPILEEWKEYVTDKLENYGYLMKLSEINNEYDYKDTYKGYRLRLDKKSLLEIIQDGLINKEININGSNEESPILKSIKGIDSYLSLFGEQLAKKIQESFKPLCNPLTDKDQFADYIDDYIYGETNGNKELFLGQKTIMQAVKKSLDVNKSTFIIAEMGSGKTLMGANIPYIHHANRNKGYNTIVMCPSHLVNVWEREIKESVPNSRVYIINTFRELIELKSKLLMKDKVENTYIVMSKESARNNYLKRPAAVWNKIKKCYVCPDCGKPLFYKKKNEILFLNELDMLTENSINSVCNNKITKWIDGEKVEVKCNAKLWQPFSNEKNHTWIKLGSDGFISKCNISNIINNLESTDKLSKKETAFLKKLKDKAEEIKEGNDKSSYSGYRRYSIAKYIKKYMKDVFDYCIIDECHEMKGLTEQGQAAANLIDSSKKTILLTGTLLNGYASGIYYLLWRTSPNLMKKEGFTFYQEDMFTEIYGTTNKESSYRLTNIGTRMRKTNSSTKKLPGISPLVFTKFLVDKAAFLSLSDMATGLPDYEEIPVPIYMDPDLQTGYKDFEDNFSNYLKTHAFEKGGLKLTRTFIQNMSIYVNAPHIPINIEEPNTDEVVYSSSILEKKNRSKEEELLKLTKEKLNKGEKVLIYYSWVNRTDCGERLLKLFADNGIKAFEMKSNISTSERENWVEKHLAKGMQVMICNPKLVETGLTLLDFTSIIFYQMSYDLFTMRQASRRSWRLSQTKDVKVYFMYYKDTIEEQTLSLIANKLQASMALEGKFSEEGLKAMSNNEDTLTQLANNVVEGIKDTVDKDIFKATAFSSKDKQMQRKHYVPSKVFKTPMNEKGQHSIFKNSKLKAIKERKVVDLNEDYLNNPLKLFL